MRGRARLRVAGMLVAGVGLLALGWSLPGALGKQAPKIGAGYSFFETLSGTRFDFSKQPIPAGFFGTGSEVIRGVVKLRGIPLRRFQRVDVGTTDTIVRRRVAVGASKTTVPIDLVALSLVSGSPLRVTYPGGKFELWDLRLELSKLKKSTGAMVVTGGSTSAGTFESSLAVWPLFTFIRRADGEQRTLDLGQLGGKAVKLTGKGRWASQPPPGALDYRLARGFWPRAFAQRATAAVQWVRQPRNAVAPAFKVFVPPVIEVAAGTTAPMQVSYESQWPYWLDLAVRTSIGTAGLTILGVAPRVLVGPRRTVVHDLIVQVAAGTPAADYPFSVKASFGTKETALGVVRVKTSVSPPPPPPPPPPPGPPPPGGDTRKLTVDARGGVTVTSTPAGITCPGDCTEDYPKDIQVALTASNPGVVWTGCPIPLAATCLVPMDTDRTVIAEPPPRLAARHR